MGGNGARIAGGLTLLGVVSYAECGRDSQYVKVSEQEGHPHDR